MKLKHMGNKIFHNLILYTKDLYLHYTQNIYYQDVPRVENLFASFFASALWTFGNKTKFQKHEINTKSYTTPM